MSNYRFTDKHGSFAMSMAENDRGLYFPLANEAGLKSAVTPNLGGDLKLDQNQFVLEPVSVENLHNNLGSRNFWVSVKKASENKTSVWSATGVSAAQEAARLTDAQDKSEVMAGIMWHQVSRESEALGLKAEIMQFIPVHKNVEILRVKITNTSSESVCITPTAAVPVYGRSADNIRDHRHVTSLLHRTVISDCAVEVTPTLSFDERGHNVNEVTYYVAGLEGDGTNPVGFFPEVAEYIGKSGSFAHPESVYLCKQPEYLSGKSGQTLDGQETVGAIRFADKELAGGESASYLVYIGTCKKEDNAGEQIAELNTLEKCDKALDECKKYWLDKCNVKYRTGDESFDRFMDWVTFQPELRRLFGCSFLPHHDYGKGGRGWRDLWQDCLALLVMNPDNVREMLIGNFGGVRIDGSNATIIGEKLGEFKADRNSITRVWMDHGVWPLVTTKLYIDQTGDSQIIYQEVPYFKDRQVARGTKVDTLWDGEKWQCDDAGKEYKGTILEHLLLQNMTSFYEVGEHNHIRLRDADWNDAIDMASKRGESVAFTNAYAMNLDTLADILEYEKEHGVQYVMLLEEMCKLIGVDKAVYDSIESKVKLLDEYMEACTHLISGKKVKVDIDELIADVRGKAEWLKNHIRETEWVSDGEGNGWYNGYYDNSGRRVEGLVDGDVRMMLTGQVFSVMSGTATDEQVTKIVKSADKYLYDADCGGYRLNTDFHEVKTDMGRMFGFAYGEKENGAVFSHMAVMYANALYKRGFAIEGYKSLETLYKQSMDYEKSRIYPGIPEYFGKGGRGLYHYLTGAASWYMLTVVTQMFGVRGCEGNLIVEPKLLAKQFDELDMAGISLYFAGRKIDVVVSNPEKLEYGDYEVCGATASVECANECDRVVIDKKIIDACEPGGSIDINITLGKRKK